ncbi:MAG: polysaccharide biosynthesis/export family protein [Terriglobales bacterium]
MLAYSLLFLKRRAGVFTGLVLTLLLLGGYLPAQHAEAAPSAPAAPVSAVRPDYRLGPGDVIRISLDEMPELSRTITLDEDAHLLLPYLHEAITAKGLTARVVARSVAEALRQQRVVVDPVVDVVVLEVHSHPVRVFGAVHTPVQFQADHPVGLLDALIRAGGPNSGAGSMVLITFVPDAGSGPDAGQSHTLAVPMADVLSETGPARQFRLTGGEAVQVLPTGQVFASGSFKKPGAFAQDTERPLTVTRLLALTDGWREDAQPDRAVILRSGPAGPAAVKVNLQRILDRRAPDLTLASDDVLILPGSRARAIGLFTLKGVAGSTLLALGYFLVR